MHPKNQQIFRGTPPRPTLALATENKENNNDNRGDNDDNGEVQKKTPYRMSLRTQQATGSIKKDNLDNLCSAPQKSADFSETPPRPTLALATENKEDNNDNGEDNNDNVEDNINNVEDNNDNGGAQKKTSVWMSFLCPPRDSNPGPTD